MARDEVNIYSNKFCEQIFPLQYNTMGDNIFFDSAFYWI